MSIIEDLKNNCKPFGLMSAEMQAKAREIKGDNWETYRGAFDPPVWEKIEIVKDRGDFASKSTYRLRPDYTEDPEIEKCGLEMKYFILKPKSKPGVDIYAMASRAGMLAYADTIGVVNPTLATELTLWAIREAEADPEEENKQS